MASFKSSYVDYQPLGVDSGFLDRIMKIQPTDYNTVEAEQTKQRYNDALINKMNDELDLKGTKQRSADAAAKLKQQQDDLKAAEEMSKIDPDLARNMYNRSGLDKLYGDFNPPDMPKSLRPDIRGSLLDGFAKVNDDGTISELSPPRPHPKDPNAGTVSKPKMVEMRNDSDDRIFVDFSDPEAVQEANANGYYRGKKADDGFGALTSKQPEKATGPSFWDSLGNGLSSLYGGMAPAAPVGDQVVTIKRKAQQGIGGPSGMPNMIPRAQ